jgi:glycosyltransferase involved in cell wall biosynthesis
LKNKNLKLLRIVYANWPEGYVNQRFLDALAKKYNVSAFFFDETGTEIIRARHPAINIPLEVTKVTVKDPPLLRIPVDVQLATKSGNIGWILKSFMRALIFRRSVKCLHSNLLIGNGVSGTNPYGFCCAVSGFHPFLVLVWGSDILVEAKKSFILRMIARFILRQADGVIVDSDVKLNAAMALGCSKNKIWKFPWGIDLDIFNSCIDGSGIRTQLGWENNGIVISTRNHFPIYGVEYLIRAIPFVVKEVSSARFLIVGDGPCSNSLKNMAKNMGVDRYVNFVGKVSNKELPKYLGAADVYVSTSFSDGASNSLLESMACGLPVVVTDIPGNREWIQNGKNGFLVPTKDSSVLAEKIAFLLKNDETGKLVGNANAELAKEKADWRKNVGALYQVVETLAVG